ncbi:MAG: hypothetical protein K6G11_04230, partial [Lachnospiraceae bacterium]|nr:hypothetical protein [Lachnospiraceae bacterium]
MEKNKKVSENVNMSIEETKDSANTSAEKPKDSGNPSNNEYNAESGEEETQREEMSTLFGVILFLIGTIASFAVLGFLPSKIGVLWYIILAVSVVIFCTVAIFTSFIGEGITKKFGKNIAYSILIVAVVIILVICYVILYRGNASSKGIGITVAAILDNSIIFFYLTASMSFKDKEDI